MPDEIQSDELDEIDDIPQLMFLASSLRIEFTPKARAATLRALIRSKREEDAQREADKPAREAAARLQEERQRQQEERRVLREHAASEARKRRQPLSPAEAIDRRAENLRGRAARVRCFVRGIDTTHDYYDVDSADADYLRMVRREVELWSTGIECGRRAVERADALREGLPSKPGRQIVARARLQLAEAEHELASARLYAATTSDPVQAPARRKLILRGRS